MSRRPALVVTALFLAACASPPGAAPAPAPGAGQNPAAAASAADTDKDKKKEEVAALVKELRLKKHELDYARIELETAELERQVRSLTVDNAVDHAKKAVEKTDEDLKLFLKVTKLKDLEERQIAHQQQTYSAEGAKDELGELEAMYQAEEFAKTTKELVLKRGRHSLELSERSLAVSKQELETLKEHTLPEREKELNQKLQDAQLELAKAGLEQKKTAIELDLGKRKAADHILELEAEIDALEQKLVKAQS